MNDVLVRVMEYALSNFGMAFSTILIARDIVQVACEEVYKEDLDAREKCTLSVFDSLESF